MNWINTTLMFAVAFVAVYLEAAWGFVHWLLGTQVDLLPALVIYASLNANLATLTLLAVLGGLWTDSLSYNPTGISILPLFIPGFVVYCRRALILKDEFYARFVLGCAASAAVPAFKLLLLLSAGQVPLLGWSSLWQWLVMTVCGGLFTPLCFHLFDWLNQLLNPQPVIESSFRPDREIRRGRN